MLWILFVLEYAMYNYRIRSVEETKKWWSKDLDIPPLLEGLGCPQSFCHSWHPAEASPKCSDMLSPFGSLSKGVWCMAECPPYFITGPVHGQQHRPSCCWPSLGSTLYQPHTCHHYIYGVQVDGNATHGLSCRWSKGRHHRHAAVNDIVHRAMTAARLPSRLEATGLFSSDGNCPDRIMLIPWKKGRLLVWDATCTDTFAPSHLRATSEAGAVAALATQSKHEVPGPRSMPHLYTRGYWDGRSFWARNLLFQIFVAGIGSVGQETLATFVAASAVGSYLFEVIPVSQAAWSLLRRHNGHSLHWCNFCSTVLLHSVSWSQNIQSFRNYSLSQNYPH